MRHHRRWRITALLAGVMLFVLAVALPAGIGYAADGTGGTYEVSIVSTNDMHAKAASDSAYGFGRVKAIADEAAKSSDLMLLLDAGDFYHGQAFATLTEGENIAKLAAATGYDAVCVGNHDWNYGKERLLDLETLTAKDNRGGSFALLGSNVKDSSGKNFFSQEYIIKEMPVSQGKTLKVGVFGVIDPKLYTKTAPANVEGLVFEDMAESARKSVASLQAQGCGLIIGMAHCIYPTELAGSVSGVNLWLAGHEHVSLEEQVMDQAGEPVYVLEAGYNGSEVDVTRLQFSLENEVKGLTVTPSSYKEGDLEKTSSDVEVDALYKSLSEAQANILKEKIGETPVKLEASWEALRIGETTMGRLVTNAYLKESGADLAVENAGGIRTGRDIEAGDVTKADAVDTFPYGNYLVTKELTGAQLREMLELCIEIGIQNQAANDAGEYDGWPDNSGDYLQVGGAHILFDAQKEKGSRIWSLEVGGQPVKDTEKYVVAVNNYEAGSKQYPMLADAEEIHQYAACDEIFIKYLQQVQPEELEQALQTACMVSQQEENNVGTEVLPEPTKLKKLTAKSRGFLAEWEKSPSATGYQIQYATNKAFRKGTTASVKIGKKTVLKKNVKGLKAKKTYYVRVRAYKTVSGKNYYSKWSGVKKIRTI